MAFKTSGFTNIPEEPKVTFWDVLKEVPSAYRKVTLETPLKIAKGFLTGSTRAATSILNTFGEAVTGKQKTFTPSNKVEKFFYGDQPVKDIYEYGRETADIVGYKPKTQLGAGLIGAPMATLDLFATPGSKAKQGISLIAKEIKSADNIFKELKEGYKVSDNIAKEIAPKLLNVTDESQVAKIIKTAELVSKIEKKSGVPLPVESRTKIGELIENTQFKDPEQAKDAFDIFVKQAIKKGKESKESFLDKNEKDLILNKFKKFEKNVSADDYIKDGELLDDWKKRIETNNITNPEVKQMAKYLEEKGIDVYDLKKERDLVESINKQELRKEEISKNKKEVFKQNREVKIASEALKKSLGKREMLGVTAGIEKDEEGNIKIDPMKAGLGVLAMGGIKSVDAIKLAKKATGKLPTKGVKKIVRQSTGQLKPQKIFRTTEEKALREKMRTAQIYSKIGKQGAIKTMKDLRNAVREYAKDLPAEIRARLLSQEQFAGVKSKKKLTELLNKVDMARTKVAINEEKKVLRQEIGHLRALARKKDIIGKVSMQAKKELGISSPESLKRANLKKLQRYKEIVKENLKSEPPTPKQIDWKNLPKESRVGSSKGISTGTKIAQGVEYALGTVSSNIRKYGGDKLFSLVREREFKINTLGKKAKDSMEGFQKGMNKLQKKLFAKGVYDEMAYSLFNQNFDRAREIAREYKFEKEFDKVTELLSDIHKRANEAGLEVGKLKNYFPRIVKDYDGLFAAYNKKFGKEGRSFFDSLLEKEANKKGLKATELTEETKSDILTKALRGYGQGKINVGNVTRARKFKELDQEFMRFYHTPQDSLTQYVSNMNQRITLKELFDVGDLERETIGAMVEKMDITPSQMGRLKESLHAVLAPQGRENIALNKLRKSATLTLLSSIQSTLFQIADIGVNAYKHGIGRAVLSLIRKKPIKRDELFTSIAHEFADSKVISKALKAVGFDRLDRLNSEAFMGNAFRQAIRQARKGKKEIKDYAEVVFRGDEKRIASFMEDIKQGKVTDDTRLYVFNKILDVSPRTMSEMPEAYAKHPNARLLYSMKSYGLKVLDIYRNDVARQWKKSPLKSAKNFIRLTGILTLAGASGSQIRDWYNGKDTKFSDNVINNMLQIMMFSTYDAANIQKDGLGKAILDKTLPPIRWINDISQDIISAGDDKGLKSIRNIPLIGTEIYNRVGRGRESIEKQNKKTNKSNKSTTGFKKSKMNSNFGSSGFKK